MAGRAGDAVGVEMGVAAGEVMAVERGLGPGLGARGDSRAEDSSAMTFRWAARGEPGAWPRLAATVLSALPW